MFNFLAIGGLQDDGQKTNRQFNIVNNVPSLRNMKYQILSNDLSKIIKEVSIAEEWDTWRGFHVAEVNRPPMPQYPFLVLSDKITIFNF